MRNIKLFLLPSILLTGILSVGLFAQPIPSLVPFRYRQNVVTNVGTNPTFITHAKDGTRRLFLVEQAGVIKVIQPGATAATEFMNITGRVLCCGERGLLGLAFHPDFENNHYFFVYYNQSDGQTRVSRFTAINNNSIGDPNSERLVLGPMEQPFSNHNGGMIEFREDSPGVHNLYISKGDGGSGSDPGNRAQNITLLLGKILRITPDVSGNNTNPAYTNPSDNPFVGAAGADEIYATGMRNAWRFSFDRANPSQMWAGDVGQGSREEVSLITRGGNFGWRVYEGFNCTGLDASLCVPSNYIMPVFDYSSASGPRCSITGGYVYRGAQRAFNTGAYIYADYCSGEILKWENNQQTLWFDTTRNITSFGEDEDGELYVVSAPFSGQPGSVDKILGNRTSADFDGDRRVDRSVYRPGDNTWYTANSGGGFSIVQFGLAGDVPAPEDYDGDGLADISVFRPSTATWYRLQSSDNTFVFEQFGQPNDIPTAGDFDADGKADLTVFRPTTGSWFSRRSTDLGVTFAAWGLNGDIPVPADFDGDNRFDFTVWRPSNGNWYTVNSTNGSFSINGWGLANDIPAQGDYDGDGKADLMVFRPSSGEWYLRRSSNGNIQVVSWGLTGDVPVAGDYDGDTVDDIAVYRPSNGVWYSIGSSSVIFVSPPWGLPNDLPVPKFDTP